MTESLLVPNSTQVPNIVLDIMGPLLLESEYRCLMYVIRRTYGFRKDADQISLEQFMHGLISKDGTMILDLGSGLTAPPIIAALKFLGRIGIVDRKGGGPGRGNKPTYHFNPSCKLVHLLNEWRREPAQARVKMSGILAFFRKCKDEISIATIDLATIDFQSLGFIGRKGKVNTPENINSVKRINKIKLQNKAIPRNKDTPLTPLGDRVVIPEGFDEFWKAYPKKKSKGQAERAWDKLHPDLTLRQQILAALVEARQGTEWLRDQGQYIPHPATWLNAKGWEDVQEIDLHGDGRANRLVSETERFNQKASEEAKHRVRQYIHQRTALEENYDSTGI